MVAILPPETPFSVFAVDVLIIHFYKFFTLLSNYCELGFYSCQNVKGFCKVIGNFVVANISHHKFVN